MARRRKFDHPWDADEVELAKALRTSSILTAIPTPEEIASRFPPGSLDRRRAA
jgi:hypothetical protein